eukprot:8150-Pyramimonas_sp.AAC.1
MPLLKPSWNRPGPIAGPSVCPQGRSCGLPKALGLFHRGLEKLHEGPQRDPTRLPEGPGSVRFEGLSKRRLPSPFGRSLGDVLGSSRSQKR